MNTLELKQVSKTIKNSEILSDISLKLEAGKVYGLVGRNGSGKTMLIRTLSGLLKPSSGEVLYNGDDIYAMDLSDLRLGVVLDGVGLYPELTGFENLSRLSRIKKEIDSEQIKAAINRVGLSPDDKRTYRKYSLGMKQRILIAQAIMEMPDILLLDEPTNGLDEDGVSLVRNIVLEEAKRGCLVIIASHNQTDIELLCDCVYRISDGMVTAADQAD